MPAGKKNIYLTFDDGPDPVWTPELLSILKKSNAKACFFVVGECYTKYPGLIEQIKADGHTIANHSFSHRRRVKLSTPQFRKQVTQFPDTDIKLYRPPHGRLFLKDFIWLKRKGYRTILWSINTKDYSKRVFTDKRINRIIKSIEDGDIVLLHNNPKHQANTKLILFILLEELLKKGYNFPPLAL